MLINDDGCFILGRHHPSACESKSTSWRQANAGFTKTVFCRVGARNAQVRVANLSLFTIKYCLIKCVTFYCQSTSFCLWSLIKFSKEQSPARSNALVVNLFCKLKAQIVQYSTLNCTVSIWHRANSIWCLPKTEKLYSWSLVNFSLL